MKHIGGASAKVKDIVVLSFFQTANLYGHLQKKRIGGAATIAQDIAMLSLFFQTANLYGHLQKKHIVGVAASMTGIAVLSFLSDRQFVRPPSKETHWRCFRQCKKYCCTEFLSSSKFEVMVFFVCVEIAPR